MDRAAPYSCPMKASSNQRYQYWLCLYPTYGCAQPEAG